LYSSAVIGKPKKCGLKRLGEEKWKPIKPRGFFALANNLGFIGCG
tara:strand:- start:542 stop:676 length:135 start_codon:yes stop_codon:yes gene_type:complete